MTSRRHPAGAAPRGRLRPSRSIETKVTRIVDGASLVEIPEEGLSVLCGCPENIVKYLIADGTIHWVEREGRRFETGPNAILLSEVPVQGGRFGNLAEFPVLQMLYRQGMIVPGHPNNDGRKPMLVGLRSQVEALAEYVYVGNYGLDDDDYVGLGLGAGEASDLQRMKLAFAFGVRKPTEELLDVRVVDKDAIPLRGELMLHRRGLNRYEFIRRGEAAAVDLNVPPGTSKPCPYRLPNVLASLEDFSVVHLGEGDGWDPTRPCMGSVVIHRGEPYLVDAGPDIEASLDAVGIGVGGLAGIFMTHVHDDHFVGLTALFRAERRLPFRAVPWVRLTATKKLCALAGMPERDFERYFDVRDLEDGRWNDVDGLGVMPVLSPHPIETTILKFRAGPWGSRRIYFHGADLTSFAVMDSMTTDDARAPGMSPAFAARAKAAYRERADLKKVDVGRGMIHGAVEDFAGDGSTVLALSHTSGPISAPFGKVAQFGEQTILRAASEDYLMARARRILGESYPSAKPAVLAALTAGGTTTHSAGSVLLEDGRAVGLVHLLLHGVVDEEDGAGRRLRSISPGSFIGAVECMHGVRARGRCRARGEAATLAIAAAAYLDLVGGSRDHWLLESRNDIVSFLRGSPAFAAIGSLRVLGGIADAVELLTLEAGEVPPGGEPMLVVLAEGGASMIHGDRVVARLGPGDFWGEEGIVSDGPPIFKVTVDAPMIAYGVPAAVVADTPHLLWHARETYDERVAAAKGAFGFAWQPEYEFGVPEIDGQHRGIFEALERLWSRRGRRGAELEEAREGLREAAAAHFAREEELLSARGYPGLAGQAEEHARLLAEIGAFRGRGAAELADLFKDWLLKHVLLMDKEYVPWIGPGGRGA